jgi:hypothetical protein
MWFRQGFDTGHDPGFSERVLNAISSVPVRRRQREIPQERREGGMTTGWTGERRP